MIAYAPLSQTYFFSCRMSHTASASVVCRGVGEVLLNQLVTCWTECAPGQLAAGPELTAVQCMEATLQCLDLLLHHLPTLFPQGGLLLHLLVLPHPCIVCSTWCTPAMKAAHLPLHRRSWGVLCVYQVYMHIHSLPFCCVALAKSVRRVVLLEGASYSFTDGVILRAYACWEHVVRRCCIM